MEAVEAMDAVEEVEALEVVEVVEFEPTEVGVLFEPGVEKIDAGGESTTAEEVGVKLGENVGVFALSRHRILLTTDHD